MRTEQRPALRSKKLVQIERRRVERQRAGVDLGEVQHVVDDREQSGRRSRRWSPDSRAARPVSGVSSASVVMPMMPLSGVRSSWLMLARNWSLALLGLLRPAPSPARAAALSVVRRGGHLVERGRHRRRPRSCRAPARAATSRRWVISCAASTTSRSGRAARRLKTVAAGRRRAGTPPGRSTAAGSGRRSISVLRGLPSLHQQTARRRLPPAVPTADTRRPE